MIGSDCSYDGVGIAIEYRLRGEGDCGGGSSCGRFYDGVIGGEFGEEMVDVLSISLAGADEDILRIGNR